MGLRLDPPRTFLLNQNERKSTFKKIIFASKLLFLVLDEYVRGDEGITLAGGANVPL